MAKRKQYGQTWWGKQWLNTLTAIDWSNRIPRGKTYANKGAVMDFEISKNKIQGYVQGSARKPYRQMLELELFDASEQESIVESISKDKTTLAVLLSRQMPQGLNQLLQDQGIELFPKDWRSLKMNCSCPDFAVPCKHLAAVIYLIANEIDKNPFILFELRGMNLLSVLEKKGLLGLNAKPKASFFQFKDFVLKEDRPLKEGQVTAQDYEQLSFVVPPNQSEILLGLLDDTALFHSSGTFKHKLQDIYKKTVRYCLKNNTETFYEEAMHQRLVACNGLHLSINKFGYLDNIWLHQDDLEESAGLLDGEQDKIGRVIQLLQSTPMEQLWQYPNQWIALHAVFRFAENVGASGNFMPRLIQIGKRYRIQWLPADIDGIIKQQIQALIDFCPENLINWSENNIVVFNLKPEEQIRLLSELFIGYWVEEACANDEAIANTDEKVLACFTDQEAFRFEDLSEREIPMSMHLWLNKFYLKHKKYVPLIRIDEQKDGFELSLQMENRKNADILPIDWKDFLMDEMLGEHHLTAIQDIQLLGQYLPQMEAFLRGYGADRFFISEDSFETIFFDVLPIMELLGIHILLPKSLHKIMLPRLSMTIDANEGDSSVGFMSLSEMLHFDWKVAIGDRMLSPAEFKALVAQKSGLVKIHNQYVHIDKNELQKLLKQLEKGPKVAPQEVIQAALSSNYKGTRVLVDQKVQDRLAAMRAIKEVSLPENLKATLRPYQLVGYSWLYKNAQLGMGAILADDMGLGKTLQVIALLLKFKQENRLIKKKSLIVVPTSLLTNWQKEVEKFAPSLLLEVYHGPQRILPKDYDVLVTSYGVLRSDTALLKKQKWALMVIDEAQHIKNVSTAQTKSVKSIKADFYVAMSGTPVENRLSEYWSIMDYTNKGYLGTVRKFIEEFANPIQREHDQKRLNSFKLITEPFILRRLKSDKSIIKDLPEKIENDLYVSLEKGQTAIYETLVKNTLKRIKEAKGIARRGLVLSLMTGLKQICNHPYQFLKKGNSLPAESGKAKALFSLLDNIRAKQEKVLIFTQYKAMGNLLSDWIATKYGRKPLFLHGGTTRKKRDEMVEAFQNNRQDSIFILSLKAGGTGLNLTAANHVIHYDLWWNPAVEAQATDRAYRIGQQKNVLVYRLLCEGTLEEKIDLMLKAKKELANLAVSTGEKWLGDLSDNDLQQLVHLNTL